MAGRGSPRYAWQRSPAFRFAASTPLGIALIVALAVVLVAGTIVDARSGLRIALRTIYGALWFQVLLGALAVNLVCCTLKAMPYRWSHAGFIVTHLSLLLVFAGAILTINFGAQGEVRIVEGGETDFYFDKAAVWCKDPSSGRSVEIPTSFETAADRLKDRFDGMVQARTDAMPGVRVLVDRYYPDASPFGSPVVRVSIPAQGVEAEMPGVTDPETRLRIEDTEYALTIMRLFFDWKDGQETGGPDSALNPAAHVVLHGPDGDSDLVLFARMPGFSMGGQGAPQGVSLVYRYASETPFLRDWRAGDPAIRVCIETDGGHKTTAWIRQYERREIALGGRTIEIEYPKRVPLGAGITLDRFVAKQYPHSGIPAAYESHLTVRQRNGSERTATVAMNAPAKVGGYVVYQSSFGRDAATGRTFTVLSLSRDPGTNVLYVGFAALIAGLIVTFYVSPPLRRREQASRTAQR
ncbi:MAG: cytochrome c biogenesis protein ResB [Verrucomicrobia bacterium]|nr:cytochrome c biogenesis protein ResB [Verrucomicrobiota bacterium]